MEVNIQRKWVEQQNGISSQRPLVEISLNYGLFLQLRQIQNEAFKTKTLLLSFPSQCWCFLSVITTIFLKSTLLAEIHLLLLVLFPLNFPIVAVF